MNTLEQLIEGAREDLRALETRERAAATIAELTRWAQRARASMPASNFELSPVQRDARAAVELAQLWVRRRFAAPHRRYHHHILVAIGVIVTGAERPPSGPLWDTCPSCGAGVGARCLTVSGEPTAIHLHRQRVAR